MDHFLGQKTQGQLMYEAAVREAKARIVRRGIYFMLAIVGTFSLVWIAFFK